mgnify:FL=1
MYDLIDSDITKARTLPSTYYTDHEKFDKIRKRFEKFWHYAGHLSQLSDCSAISVDHMGDLIGEPMMMTDENETRCISNVCTHRGMLICNNKSRKHTLRCPYHGRTFALDGSFKAMPEFDDVIDFPSPKDDLESFPTMVWKGLVFAGIDPSGISTCIEEMQKRVGWMPIEKYKYDPTRDRSYEIKANWALYVDNYLEGFHIPFVHQDLNTILDYENYRTETFDGGVVQIGIANKDEQKFSLPDNSPDFGLSIAAYYYWIFPGLMLNFYPWGLSVNIIIPISVNRTRIIFQGFVGDLAMLGKGAGGDLDKVEAEDQEIVEATHKGVSSGLYHRGRYSPTKEKGVHHFHMMLTEHTT